MTDQEKYIYNKYLATTRSQQDKPFKLRQNFTNFEKSADYISLKKIVLFFNKYNHIKPETFFEAPYKIHTDTAHLPLNYFLTRAAIKCYSLYLKKQQDVSPDKQLNSIKDSLHYIGMFCLRHKIDIDRYIYHKTGYTYSWLIHYKNHHINIYSLFELGDIGTIVADLPADEQYIFASDLIKDISAYKIRYYNSPDIKKLVQQGLIKIKNFLKNA